MKKALALILCALMLITAIPTALAVSDTVTAISAEYTKPLIENTSGYITEDNLGNEYFMYDIYDDGLMITATYSDGETETMPYYMFEDVSLVSDQGYKNQWGIGDHNVTVRYAGKRTTATLTIIESPVERIEAEMLRPLVFGVDGWMEYDFTEDWEEISYFRYNLHQNDALQLTVYFKNGEIIIGTLDEILESGEYSFDITDDQSYVNQWGLGTHSATVKFMGSSADFDVEIVESDLDSITVRPSRDLIEGVDCTWIPIYDYETWEETGKYPYYNIEDYLDVTVTYDDGYSIDCKASELSDMTGIGMDINDDQNEYNIWSVGQHTLTGSYMGVPLEFTVNLVENPFTAIEIYESANKELHLLFTKKDGSVIDCTAQKIYMGTDISSLLGGDGTLPAEIVTDNGTYNVHISGEDSITIRYGTLESNTLSSCDWLKINDLTYSIATSTVLYQVMSTVEAPNTFYGYSTENADSCIDYVSSVCALPYILKKLSEPDEDTSSIIDTSEDEMLISVIADIDGLKEIANDIFGTEYNFTVLDGYDSETGTVKIPLLYPSLLSTGAAELIAAVGNGGMDSCVFENGSWITTVNYDYIDDMGALQTGCMTITVSPDMKVLSVDLGLDYLEGDLTMDGKVNTQDSNLLKRIILGERTPTIKELAAGDLKKDRVLNTKDAYLLKLAIANS